MYAGRHLNPLFVINLRKIFLFYFVLMFLLFITKSIEAKDYVISLKPELFADSTASYFQKAVDK